LFINCASCKLELGSSLRLLPCELLDEFLKSRTREATLVLTEKESSVLLSELTSISENRMYGKLIKWAANNQMCKAGMRRKILDKAGFKFYYCQRGKQSTDSDNPTLLILYGFTESCASFAKVVRKLPRHIHVVIVDIPGHGKAPYEFPPDIQDRKVRAFAMFIREFIIGLELNLSPSGLHLLGFSFGGTIAGTLAAFFGKELRIHWLTLMAPSMITPVKSPFWHAVQQGKFVECMIPHTIEETRSMVMNSTGMTMEQTQTKKMKILIKGLLELNRPRMRERRAVWEGVQQDAFRWSELEKHWAKITAKTQMLWGTNDVIIDPSGAPHLAKIIPDSHVEWIKGAPHQLDFMVPDKVALAITLFREKARREEEEKPRKKSIHDTSIQLEFSADGHGQEASKSQSILI